MKRAMLIVVLVIITIALGVRVLGARGKELGTTLPASDGTLGASALSAPSQQSQSSMAISAQGFARRNLHSMRLVSTPQIDGNLADWPAGESIELNRSTAFSFLGGIAGLNDLSAVIRSGWDENTLYFAIEVRDDVLVTDSTDVWRDDGVEMGLDGLYDRYAWGTDDHQYTVVADGRRTDRGVPTDSISAGVLTYGGGYNIEVAIPILQLIPGVPISGTVMGFTIGLHDDDDGGNWDAYLIWEGTTTGDLPEQFGNLIFSERLEDRIAILEAKIVRLERRTQELLTILAEFEQMTPP